MMTHSLKRRGEEPKTNAEPARLQLNQQVQIDCSLDDIREFLAAIWSDPRIQETHPNIEIEMPTLSPNGEKTYVTGTLTEKYFFSLETGKIKMKATGSEQDWIDTVLSGQQGKSLAKRVQQQTFRSA
jgi:hypothetical protein